MLVYELFWLILIPILFILSKTLVKKWAPGFHERQANYSDNFPDNPIWFHAVSVGEFNALYPLLNFFHEYNLVISVSTKAGYEHASKKLAARLREGRLVLIYMPFDQPSTIKKSLLKIQPRMIICLETEIWPGLIYQASKMKIKLGIINARLADKSFKSYQSFRFLFSKVINKFDFICAQSPEDSRKFIQLGLDSAKVYMCGNMKFAKDMNEQKPDPHFKYKLGYSEKNMVILAASTHAEEEASLIAMYQELAPQFPELRLIIAPRKPERFYAVAEIIDSAAKLEVRKFSESNLKLNNQANPQYGTDDILLIDTIGDLADLYKAASMCFVGGTLVEHVGGHNILEPCALGLATIIGPFYHKNTAIVELFYSENALIIADSKLDLKNDIRSLLIDDKFRRLTGKKALKLVQANQKILPQVSKVIKEYDQKTNFETLSTSSFSSSATV